MRGEFTRDSAPPYYVLTSTCCAAGEQPGSAACCSRFNREDGHQRPGASPAPCCRRSTPVWPAASSRWSLVAAAAAASNFVLDCPRCTALGVCQHGPTSPPPACRRLLRNLLGRAPE